MLAQALLELKILKCTKVPITGSSVPTALTAPVTKPGEGTGKSGGTEVVELTSDTDCFIAIGPNPTASLGPANCTYLPAKVPRRYSCNAGDSVAVIGTGGNLYITEGQ